MNDQCYKRYKLYVYAALALSVLFAVVYAVFNSIYYEYNLNLYKFGAPFFLIVTICLIAVVFFASALFTLDSDMLPLVYPKKSSHFTGYASALTSFCLLATVVFQFFGSYNDHLAALYATKAEALSTASLMLKVSLVLAVIGAVYFLLVFLTDKTFPMLALISCAWIFAYILRMYYDMTEIIVDPVREMTFVSLSAAVLFLLAEIRMSLRKPSPKFFVFSALVASFFCFGSGFAKITAVFMSNEVFGIQTVYNFFEIAFALYAVSRLLTFTNKARFDGMAISEKTENIINAVDGKDDIPDIQEAVQKQTDMPSEADTESLKADPEQETQVSLSEEGNASCAEEEKTTDYE